LKLSVIVPCYKFKDYIKECVDSILAQKTNFEFEVLIRDDFSNDGTIDVLEQYSSIPNVKIFTPTENLGFHNNIRFLLESAEGEYIAYIDGDDYWTYENKLQHQVDYLDSNPNCSMCFMGYFVETDDAKANLHGNSWQGPPIELGDYITTDMFLNYNPVNSLTRVFRNYKDLFQDYFYEFSINDWLLNYELSTRGSIYYINIPAGVYRDMSNSFHSLISEEQYQRDIKNIRRINEGISISSKS
jgi:glycosyltransferase involved in cell wall biosynthesis